MSVKIKIQLNFFTLSGIGTLRVNLHGVNVNLVFISFSDQYQLQEIYYHKFKRNNKNVLTRIRLSLLKQLIRLREILLKYRRRFICSCENPNLKAQPSLALTLSLQFCRKNRLTELQS